MPTFEERYTAWIDGTLASPELEAFERELAATSLPSAEADREDAHRLGRLLRRYSDSPPLTNGEFFQHQLSARLAAAEAPRPHEVPARSFLWSLPNLAWAAAFCLLLTFTIYRSSPPVPMQVAPPVAVVSDDVSDGLLPDEPRVFEARTDDPAITVTPVHSEKDGLAVVWLDGLDYLPASYQLQ